MRKLSELKIEELETLIEDNSKLNGIIYDEFIESEKFWIDEEIHFLKSGIKNYHIGSYGINYIDIDDHEYLLQGYHKVNETFSGSFEFADQLEKCEEIRYEPDKQEEFNQAVEKLNEIKLQEYNKRIRYNPDNEELHDHLLSNIENFEVYYIDNMSNIFRMIAA